MTSLADISIEFAHVHLGQLDEQGAEQAARMAAGWLMPLVGAYEDAGLVVSTVVMVDDYFAPVDTDVAEKVTLLRDACEAADVRIDHVVREASCAESVGLLRRRLAVEPRVGDGSASPAPADTDSEWLANADPPRRDWRTPPSVGRMARSRLSGGPVAAAEVRARGAARRQHSIHLDVQLWKDVRGQDTTRLWACPALAAWWQLIRLGALLDADGRPSAPDAAESRSGAPPLPARRTLTLLDPLLLEVEHAVRVILERVMLPDAWRRHLREGAEPAGTHEHLKRIAYMFIPAGFPAAVGAPAASPLQA